MHKSSIPEMLCTDFSHNLRHNSRSQADTAWTKVEAGCIRTKQQSRRLYQDQSAMQAAVSGPISKAGSCIRTNQQSRRLYQDQSAKKAAVPTGNMATRPWCIFSCSCQYICGDVQLSSNRHTFDIQLLAATSQPCISNASAVSLTCT